MTEKLYYAEPSLLDFDASVIRCSPAGAAWEAVLDRTCFYPGGGGQPSDRGTLNGVPVLDVRELDDGQIVHVLDREVPAGPIHAIVDAARRRDFMEQHTGQHIFSQALVRAGSLETVSVHLGDEDTTIEVKAQSVEDSVLRAAEEIANEVIREHRPVILHEIDRSEVSKFPLRRTPPDEGRLRIIEVKDYDWAACGGVHVASAGEVFMVKAVSQEKIRGRVRIHILIGRRAFQDYGRKVALTQSLSRLLTCGEETLLARVQDMMAAQQEAARELRQLRTAQAAVDAEAAVAGGRRLGEAVLVRAVFDAAGPDYLKAFAEHVVAAPGRVVLAADKAPQSFQWIVAHSLGDGVELSTAVMPHFAVADAKGGGRGSRMQGVGTRVGSLAEFLDAVEADVSRVLSGRKEGA